ncbi:MAG: isoprenylcysteine carboxylmethyltransferase family protein [Candidatus Omnitrophota bacterium]
MNKKKSMIKMNILGIGPMLFAWTVCYGAVMVYLNSILGRGFFLNSLPQYVTFAVGDILLFVGVIILYKSFIVLREAQQKGVRAAKGFYGFLRHPMYAAWIFFIVPGIAVIGRSLFLLSTSLFAYFVYKCLIGKEEEFLVCRFGPVSKKRFLTKGVNID